MKPLTGFNLVRPRTLQGALTLMATLEKTQPIAGGTDLIPLYREVQCEKTNLIDLSLINELNGITESLNCIVIGSTTTHTQILSNNLVAKHVSALHDSCSVLGSVQIRNRGTIGGNICNASPAADTAPPLLVHNAEVNISNQNNNRWIPLEELFKGPKLTVLQPDELLLKIKIPIDSDSASAFKRLGRRKGFTLSIVNAAAFVKREEGLIQNIRLSIGSVAPTPLRIKKVEEEFLGIEMSKRVLDEIGQACSDQVKPIDDIRGTAEYRRDMSNILIKRALNEAWRRTGGIIE
ncbi:xanthine dehydrogenase family protein subunit M [Candidatus Bathyarchaeota archaeon]|nr:xanthine dehydrogenase family protein subunit M [Candidatus Bathyarchaeota archaeon]